LEGQLVDERWDDPRVEVADAVAHGAWDDLVVVAHGAWDDPLVVVVRLSAWDDLVVVAHGAWGGLVVRGAWDGLLDGL